MDRLAGARLDIAAAAVLYALALLARLPYLQLVPRYTDEVRRIIWSVRIAGGGFWPLAFKNGYNGPLLMYSTALGLHVHWSVATPRVVTMWVGALAVPLTYAAGRSLGGRVAGATAALLMVTSFVPVVVFGHVAWAITLSGAVMVAGWWAAMAAVKSGRGRHLIAAGFASGLAVQCHPAAAFALPGLAAWLLGQPAATRRRLQGAVPAAFAAAVVAYSPIGLHHFLQWRREGVSTLTTTRDVRAGGMFDAAQYGHALRDLTSSFIDALSGAGHHPEWPWTADPVAGFVVVVSLLAIGWCAWRGPRLPVCLIASVLLLQPLVIREYNFPLSARYSGLFVPAIYLAIGAATAAVWRAWADAAPTRRALGRLLVALGVATWAAVGMLRVLDYYEQEVAIGATNAAIRSMATASADGPVVLDDEIDAHFSASGQVSRVLEALFLLQRTPHDKRSTPAELDADLRERRSDAFVIVSDAHRASMALGGALVAVPGQAVARSEDGDGYALYRWTGATGRPMLANGPP